MFFDVRRISLQKHFFFGDFIYPFPVFRLEISFFEIEEKHLGKHISRIVLPAGEGSSEAILLSLFRRFLYSGRG